MEKLIEHSDGAKVDVMILDDFVSDYVNGEDVSIDDMLRLCKQAQDHLKSLRAALKREAVK